MSKLSKIFIVWIIFYNVVFFAYVVYFQRPDDTIIGIFPLSTFWYIIMLIVIAVVNWIIGWRIMNTPQKNISDNTEKGV